MWRAALILLLACAPPAHWPPRPAEHPATRAELVVYRLTVHAGSAEDRAAFERALAARGFRIVEHEPYRNDLQVTLTREGDQLVATLRSDDFFVDEALGPDLDSLAATLAVSDRVATFIRNSGLPQQRPVSAH
jgi:hypothetical protein